MNTPTSARERMSLVFTGHVDHGKSTIVGRLLADTDSLPKGKLEEIRAACERAGRPFEYAFVLDALKEERSKGITIDAARAFFRTEKRDYVIIDAPGHTEFLRNMVTGASRADVACLVIDAREGIRDNSRRHGFLLSMLGIRRLFVVVNKMDQVGYGEHTFQKIVAEYSGFLAQLGTRQATFIPASGLKGDNIVTASQAMPWYNAPSLLEQLQAVAPSLPESEKPFRMPVQDVYRVAEAGRETAIIAGTIETGRIHAGDPVVFYPSGIRSAVRSIETFPRSTASAAYAGRACGFTIADETCVRRGDLMAKAGEPPPQVSTTIRTSLFWLGNKPLETGKRYVLRLGTARINAAIAVIHTALNAITLESRSQPKQAMQHEVADCTLALEQPLAFDPASESATTGRFVLVDDYEIQGGGIVLSPGSAP